MSTKGNYKDGCMQDIHWAVGAFGYFLTYTLGAMYAAQFRAAMCGLTEAPAEASDLKDASLGAQIETRDLNPIISWLDRHVWKKVWKKVGSTKSVAEILKEATGESLNPRYFRNHLEGKYLSAREQGQLSKY